MKPSIAVLPFANMSGDPEQEYFVDGLTEDIITELSRRHELFVISRNSSFVYKGQSVNLRETAQKLGAQYLVEGSVRKSGQHLRVTAQLIDTATDTHIWAERYDRKLDDVFAIQDELTTAIVATLPGRVEAAQQEQVARKTPTSLAAYECVLAAKVRHHRSDRAENEEALKLITRAVELDPDYAHAHAWRGCILGQAWTYGWCADKDATFDQVVRELEMAQALDDNDADVHRILAAVNISRNDLNKARYHQERSFTLNPNYDLVVVQQGELLTWLGRPKEGIEWIQKAMRLNPHHPSGSGAISARRTSPPANTAKQSRRSCICRRWMPRSMPSWPQPMAGSATEPLPPRTMARYGSWIRSSPSTVRCHPSLRERGRSSTLGRGAEDRRGGSRRRVAEAPKEVRHSRPRERAKRSGECPAFDGEKNGIVATLASDGLVK